MAISSWRYGKGLILYTPKFNVGSISGNEGLFSDALTSIVKTAYFYLSGNINNEIICPFYATTPNALASGNIKIINKNNKVEIIEN